MQIKVIPYALVSISLELYFINKWYQVAETFLRNFEYNNLYLKYYIIYVFLEFFNMQKILQLTPIGRFSSNLANKHKIGGT